MTDVTERELELADEFGPSRTLPAFLAFTVRPARGNDAPLDTPMRPTGHRRWHPGLLYGDAS